MDEPSAIELSDGRTLSYAEYGDPGGTPVVSFHGVVGSRLMWSLADDAATDRAIRLVAPDRPGFGRSEFQAGRRLLDWPSDVSELADHLGIDSFGVVGFSGGGPHAMACARAVPGRVRGVSLVSSVTPPETRGSADPFNEAVLSAMRFVPGFSQAAFGCSAWLAANARSQFRTALVASSAPPDRAMFDGPAGETLVADSAESFRGGSRGPAHDLALVGTDWGFDPRECPFAVDLWHGRGDQTVGVALARAFGDLLPNADLYLTDDAHYSTFVHSPGEIVSAAAE